MGDKYETSREYIERYHLTPAQARQTAKAALHPLPHFLSQEDMLRTCAICEKLRWGRSRGVTTHYCETCVGRICRTTVDQLKKQRDDATAAWMSLKAEWQMYAEIMRGSVLDEKYWRDAYKVSIIEMTYNEFMDQSAALVEEAQLHWRGSSRSTCLMSFVTEWLNSSLCN